MSFFCPHFDYAADRCTRLKCDCVPGRPGCVLRGKVVFAVPAEERLKTSTRKRGEGPTKKSRARGS